MSQVRLVFDIKKIWFKAIVVVRCFSPRGSQNWLNQMLTDFEAESVDSVSNSKESPLHLAAMNGFLQVVGILLDVSL